MSRKKERPVPGTLPAAGMSLRDMAAALGISKSELHRWGQLAALPEEVFEARLAEAHEGKRVCSATGLLRDAVPARGRVQRALALVANMPPAELTEFAALLARVKRTP